MSNIIGCGSGRCGTMSLAALIDSFEGWSCTHEREPNVFWEPHEDILCKRLDFFKSHPKVGDVGVDYLPHLDYFFQELSDLRVICLKRNKKDTVKSFFAKMYLFDPPRNLWVEHGTGLWTRDQRQEKRYPTFDLTYNGKLTKDQFIKKSIERYWDFYYERAEKLSERYTEFKIFDISILNKESQQKKMLDFLDVEDSNLNLGVSKNKLINDENRDTEYIERRLDRYEEEK